MFHRVVKHAWPLVSKLNQRAMSSRRNLPIRTPWSSNNLMSDFFQDPKFMWRDFRDTERTFQDMWRQMEKMMSPRFFDAYYIRPRDVTESNARSEVAELKYDKEGFELKLDVHQYKPEELNVKLAGNRLSVSGKHEQKQDDHGFVSREFQREIEIPEDVDLESLTSSLSEGGILSIRANVKGAEKPPEKQIEIKAEVKQDGQKTD